MKNLVVCLCVLLVAGGAFAQPSPDAIRSDAILTKIRKIDLLNQILPLLLTKEQLRDFLPVIEKARANVKKIESIEASDLKGVEAKVDSTIAAGLDKGEVPPKAYLVELNKMFQVFAIRRELAINENVELVLPVVKAGLNPGQVKTMANSLDLRFFQPGAKPEEMKDEDKVKIFVREILLDPLSYDLLVKLSK